MASATWDGIYIAPASDLSDTTYLGSAEFVSVTVDKQKRGQVRYYSGGRTRSITLAGTTYIASVSADHLSKAKKETLQDLAGEIVLIRIGRGQTFFGTFYSAPGQEERGSAELCSLRFTVTQITRTLEV
jgi:hypothetical protein